LVLACALAGHVMQQGLIFSAERLRPDWGKLSLIAGFKRLFGLDGLVNFVKGLLKLGLVGAAAFASVWQEGSRVATAVDLDPAGIVSLGFYLAGRLLIVMLVVFALIAAADYFYQRQRWRSRHRMSRQE